MGIFRHDKPEASDRELDAANLDGCLLDIEHYLEQIQALTDEARSYLQKLSK